MENSQILFGGVSKKEILQYNAEHRPNFNIVLKDIRETYCLTCEGCNVIKYSTCFYSYMAKEYICSKECRKKYIATLPIHMQSWFTSNDIP